MADRAILAGYLRSRLAGAFRQFNAALQDLPPEEAHAQRRADWRRYRHGEGLNGSIAGIVHHVGAWKHAAAAALADGRSLGVEAYAPSTGEWHDLVGWLNQGQQAMEQAFAGWGDDDLSETVELAGYPMSRGTLATIMLEHDQYHAGQINLLRQQLGHDLTDD